MSFPQQGRRRAALFLRSGGVGRGALEVVWRARHAGTSKNLRHIARTIVVLYFYSGSTLFGHGRTVLDVNKSIKTALTFPERFVQVTVLKIIAHTYIWCRTRAQHFGLERSGRACCPFVVCFEPLRSFTPSVHVVASANPERFILEISETTY